MPMETDNSAGKRTRMSRHLITRNIALDWISKDIKLKEEMDMIINENKRIVVTRKQALWKSWLYHVASPLASSLQKHLQSRCFSSIGEIRQNLFQDYLNYSNDPKHVSALDFHRPDLYDPFVLKNHRCFRVVTKRLREPFLMNWMERIEEKEFINSTWSIGNEGKMKKASSRGVRGYSKMSPYAHRF